MEISNERKIYDEIQKYLEMQLGIWSKTETDQSYFVDGYRLALEKMRYFIDKDVFAELIDEWREEEELEKVYNGEYVEGWEVVA